MVGKAFLAALAACACTCGVQADDSADGLDLGRLALIRDTVCAPDEAILFIPVSNDVPVAELTYAVVPAAHLDTISVHIVTREQRTWLSLHGCRTAQPVRRTNVSQVRASGNLDF